MHDASGPEQVGLRERKKLRTKAQLAEAALRLFSARGFDEVTVEDIAAQVEVSPRTFFRYFAAKEDVLFGDMQTSLDLLRQSLAGRPPGEPTLVALREAVLSLAENYEVDSADVRRREAVITRTPSLLAHGVGRQVAWEEAIARTLGERDGKTGGPDLTERLLSACAIASLRVAFNVWIERGGTGSLPDLAWAALGQLEAGFARGTAPPDRRGEA